jgi:hypothetical protein
MGLQRSLVEVIHDDGYGEFLLPHINTALGNKDMRAVKSVNLSTGSCFEEPPQDTNATVGSGDMEDLAKRISELSLKEALEVIKILNKTLKGLTNE